MNVHAILYRSGRCILFGLFSWLCFFPPASFALTAATAPAERNTIIMPVIQSGELPDKPIIFVSRNRLETWRKIHIGPPVDVAGRELTPGGKLLRWQPDNTVIDLTAGTPLYDVQQPDVSFDGTRVVFAAVTEPGGAWRLWQMSIDGNDLRQLTFSDRNIPIPQDPEHPDRNENIFGRYGDFGPAYLPDGRILFSSTRYMTLSGSCGQRGQNLYVLWPETGEIKRRTTERAGAVDPFVLSDGKILFSHWIDAANEPADQGPGLRPLETDYNFSFNAWAVWVMHPDGGEAGRYAYLRGGLMDGGGIHHPRELNNKDLIVSFRGNGSLLGDTLAAAVTRITPGPTEPHALRFLGNPYIFEADHALAPAPLPDGSIVVSYTPTTSVTTDEYGLRRADFDYGLYVANDTLDILIPLYNAPDTDELDAIVVTPRSAAIIPDEPNANIITDDPTVDLGTTATLINHNVYADLPPGPGVLPSPRVGTVAQIEVYDDAQTFLTSEDYPLLRKQMPRLLGSFPVNAAGAFSAVVPADRPLLFVLTDQNGVAVRSPMALKRPNGVGRSIPHSFNGHDYLRPGTEMHCRGCHKGHMFNPDASFAAQANLSRLSTATASSESNPFFHGAWRATDLRLNGKRGAHGWITDEGQGAWIELAWPGSVAVGSVSLYPLVIMDAHMNAATLSMSDNAQFDIKIPEDGSPVTLSFDEPHRISWMRFTVTRSQSNRVGLSEWVVTGAPDHAEIPDTAPPAPVNVRTTDGVVLLQWHQTPERSIASSVAGYRVYYGSSPGAYDQSVTVGNVTHFLMRDLLNAGHTYYFALKSYNTHGTESEVFSNEVSAAVRAPVITDIEPNSGPVGGGTPITITGDGFAPRGVKVKIGNHLARNVVVVNQKTITALTHYHRPGPVDVKILNPDNHEGVLSNAFYYNGPPLSETINY